MTFFGSNNSFLIYGRPWQAKNVSNVREGCQIVIETYSGKTDFAWEVCQNVSKSGCLKGEILNDVSSKTRIFERTGIQLRRVSNGQPISSCF